MSLPEVMFRARRWATLQTERLRIASGWAPKPRHRVRPGIALIPNGEGWLDRWRSAFSLDDVKLEHLLVGEIEVFSTAVRVGESPDWHREPVTGKQMPITFGKFIDYRDEETVGNIKVLWELGRHQHLLPAAVAYAVTGDARYRSYLSAQVSGWIAGNPFGRGVHWCTALEAALRLISWAFIDALLKLRNPSDGFLELGADPVVLGDSVFQHAWFIRGYLSRHSSANNHLIGELTGLLVATTAFDMGKQGTSWRSFAKEQLELESGEQVFSDGVDKEQALYYHLWVLEYFVIAWLAAQRAGLPFSIHFAELIRRMAAFVEAMTPVGGTPPQIGDSDDGFATRFTAEWPSCPYDDVLSATQAIFTQGDCDQRPAPAKSEKAFWYAAAAHDELPVPAPVGDARNDSYPRIFEQSGYAVMGDGALHLVFDAGSLGYPAIAAHGHADALSICLAVDGEWWLVDPGTYCYHNEPEWRQYFRGTSAHSTLVVDNGNQSTSGGAFLWIRHADAALTSWGSNDHDQWAAGSHNGYPDVVHQREVRFDAGAHAYRIVDTVQGPGSRELRLHFHFHPGVSLRSDGQGAWVATMAGRDTKCSLTVDAGWSWDVCKGATSPILGWYSSALHRKEPSPVLRGTRRGDLPVRVETVLAIQQAKR